ncbi:sugar phosphate isomerase/epimerase [Paenibacillus sp. TRM 82003]|nr:sugar phosphate isomerase/epimerase [Paenibacillus sp. TRM 82003]
MIEEIQSLGFERVELNYNVGEDSLATIEPMIESGEARISSVHHAFPRTTHPFFGPDSILFAHPDEELRRVGEELLLQSAEYAHRYGAAAVVLHPGETIIPYQFDAELKRLYNAGQRNTQAYECLLDQMKKQREEDGRRALPLIQESLERVCERLEQRGNPVWIGIETRARCHQIPTLREAAAIIDALRGAPVHLWLDTGHAIMMERMGLYDNTEDLPDVLHHVKGVHIHDTVGLSDHWCPYVHSDDPAGFHRFLPAIAAADIRVYELKSVCEREEIEACHAELTAALQALGQGEVKSCG